jgi:hypothetical protein
MILEFLTSGVIGTITGLIGNAVTSYVNYKHQKLKNDHDVAMSKLDQEAIKLEAEMNVKIERSKTEGQIMLAEVDALKESYKTLEQSLFEQSYMQKLWDWPYTRWLAALISYLFASVDYMKHMIRPALTIYLIGASTWITVICHRLLQLTMGDSMTVTDTYDLFKVIVMTLIYLTTSTVSWWFSDRRSAKFLMRLQDGNLKNQTDL